MNPISHYNTDLYTVDQNESADFYFSNTNSESLVQPQDVYVENKISNTTPPNDFSLRLKAIQDFDFLYAVLWQSDDAFISKVEELMEHPVLLAGATVLACSLVGISILASGIPALIATGILFVISVWALVNSSVDAYQALGDAYLAYLDQGENSENFKTEAQKFCYSTLIAGVSLVAGFFLGKDIVTSVPQVIRGSTLPETGISTAGKISSLHAIDDIAIGASAAVNTMDTL